MSNMDDYELHREYIEPPPDTPRRISGWLLVPVVVIALGAAAWIYLSRDRQLETPAAPRPAARAQPEGRLGGIPEPIALPSLDESDAVVRTLVRALSNHPAIAAWLATDDLVRSFTAAVSNIAGGVSPAKQLNALRPHNDFTVMEKDGKYYIDPRSYERYEGVADAVGSIDPAGAAKLYATLKPRIDDAAGELGLRGEQVDRTVEQAIVVLLRTPTPDGPVLVTANVEGIGYAFADGRFERLSPSQKALVRMGPRNARIIKARLREIAIALGIPPARLPSE
jgi:hypothetical protein